MKNPFRKTPMQQLEATIGALAKRDEQLVAKRAMAQDALDKAIKARQQALLAGDLDDHRALDKLQGTVDTAASTLAGIDDALAILAQQKAEAERLLSAERERIERAAAADKLHKRVAAIEAALPSYLAQSRALADALSEIGHWHFESGQMSGFLQNTMGQIEIAANFTLAELKAMPDAIRQGRQAIPREPASTPVVVTEPTPEMTRPALTTPTSDPLASANFQVIDRSAETRTLTIEVQRL
jgi:chromosome segregation ATPase